jgi:hypothetical protein
MMLDDDLCWAVLAPLAKLELEAIVTERWRRQFPFGTDPAPWEVLEGTGDYSAIISRLPGSEGADWNFAEIASKRGKKKKVYSLWLDPERFSIFEWTNGKHSEVEGSPRALAAELGFESHPVEPLPTGRSVALVEGATVEQVRAVLESEPWLSIEAAASGVLLHSSDGRLGTQAWDAAEALPEATVYLLHHWLDDDAFEVTVLRGASEVGSFRLPDLGEPHLDQIKGLRTPREIAVALGVPPELLDL